MGDRVQGLPWCYRLSCHSWPERLGLCRRTSTVADALCSQLVGHRLGVEVALLEHQSVSGLCRSGSELLGPEEASVSLPYSLEESTWISVQVEFQSKTFFGRKNRHA